MDCTRRQMMAGMTSTFALASLGGCKEADIPGGESDLTKLDGVSQASLIADGHMSAEEAVTAALERIEKVDPEINAFVDVRPEQALEKARNLPFPDRPYSGLPYALKDLNEYPGMKWERGTAMFKGAMGEKKTPYTQKIDETGVIILGKTATPEFGLLGTTEPLAYKSCKNPWNTGHSAGGSSGGAAAAVAARIIPIAQASDGGGSIRNPAAQCGLVGLKPSRGRFPDQGNPARAIDLSIKHCVSLSVRDNALMLALTEAENGPLDPVGLVKQSETTPKRIAVTVNDLQGRPPHPDVANAVMEAAKQLEELGHQVEMVDAGPGVSDEITDDFTVLWGEAVVPIVDAANKMAGGSARDAGLLEGWTVDLADNVRSLSEQDVAAAFVRLEREAEKIRTWLATYDAWLTPSASMPAPELGWTRGDLPFAQNSDRSGQLVGHFSMHNLAGTPSISLPWGLSGGLPIGVLLSSGIGNEKTLLELSYQIEEARPWIDTLPPVVA
ncbi:amidase family protein [Alterisphingorhabdus coralli]|uniref:Amidase family protein n=1 Tax=Alterisphingorhabdus coralli TaxID=3071408 RepID=A0AA97F6G8_9SPHN|nr:amidase family protein [Parasphingorhabdus sp. SCSIO 66989]WOE75284.1 amidase family protein [Parasphingorhabdus sp. SCSIO 66989]